MAHGHPNGYYDSTNKIVYDGTTANAVDLNAINLAIDSSLERVATDLDTILSQISTGDADSELWAEAPQGTPPDPLQPTKFSSLANAEEAEDWANASNGDFATGDTINKADGTTSTTPSAKTSADYSKTQADDAAASAASAASLITNADGVAGTAPITVTSVPDGDNFDLTISLDGVTAISTDGTLVGNSDTELPTEQAVKTYVDTKGAANSAANSVTDQAYTDSKIAALVKADVGLGSADNTSDVNKPVSTAQQTESDTKEDDLGIPLSSGQVLSSTTGSVRSWVDLYTDLTIPSGVMVTGNMYGLDYSMDAVTPDEIINVTKGVCFDSLNTTKLTLSVDTSVNLISDYATPTINTIYNIFLTNLGEVHFDTSITGATLIAGTASQVRWLGFILTNSSGDISGFVKRGDKIEVKLASEFTITTVGSTYVLLDPSNIIPVDRIDSIDIKIHASVGASLSHSVDGTNFSQAMFVGAGWYMYISNVVGVTTTYARADSGTGTVYLTGCRLKR